MNNVVAKGQDVSLMEVLDRVLEKGVVISGDIVISVADVDLIFLGLRAILSSVETMEQARRLPLVPTRQVLWPSARTVSEPA